MHVGLMLPTFHPLEINDLTLTSASAAGIESLWTFDHLMLYFHPDLWPEYPMSENVADPDSSLDPFCLVASLARLTSLPLGIAATDSTRRRAADVARAALTLHHMASGGFHLALGSGLAHNLLPFGYPFDNPVARCEAFLRDLRSLFDTGRLPDGGSGRLGILLTTPAGPPKIWVAAHGPRMLRLTGEYGDGWLPQRAMTPSEYRVRREAILAHAMASSRPEPRAAYAPVIVLGDSRDRLAEMFDAEPLAKLNALLSSGQTWRAHGLVHPCGEDAAGVVDLIVHELDPDELRALATKIPIELVEDTLVLGNAQEIAARLAPYADAGCDTFVLLNGTGAVGGASQAIAHAPELPRLVAALKAL